LIAHVLECSIRNSEYDFCFFEKLRRMVKLGRVRSSSSGTTRGANPRPEGAADFNFSEDREVMKCSEFCRTHLAKIDYIPPVQFEEQYELRPVRTMWWLSKDV
jgi:hypothetical protein